MKELERLRVYVAGPLSAASPEERKANVHRAMDAAIQLIDHGFAPLCPHLTHWIDKRAAKEWNWNFDHAEWLAVDLPWLACADAVLRLPGPSLGADMETEMADKLGIPIYTDLQAIVADPPARRPVEALASEAAGQSDCNHCDLLPCKCERKCGDAGFHAILAEIGELHAKKAADYGRGEDPLANCRSAEEFGLSPWVGVLVRMGDKMHRVKSYLQNGKLANEGVEDSLLDLASYAIIALRLFREERDA